MVCSPIVQNKRGNQLVQVQFWSLINLCFSGRETERQLILPYSTARMRGPRKHTEKTKIDEYLP